LSVTPAELPAPSFTDEKRGDRTLSRLTLSFLDRRGRIAIGIREREWEETE